MLLLQVYVPESHLDSVKAALFAAGAGKIGNYDSCSWQTKGTGQFRPLAGSTPYIGVQGQVESVEEWKIEMVCENYRITSIVHALKASHPYETPAYQVLETLLY